MALQTFKVAAAMAICRRCRERGTDVVSSPSGLARVSELRGVVTAPGGQRQGLSPGHMPTASASVALPAQAALQGATGVAAAGSRPASRHWMVPLCLCDFSTAGNQASVRCRTEREQLAFVRFFFLTGNSFVQNRKSQRLSCQGWHLGQRVSQSTVHCSVCPPHPGIDPVGLLQPDTKNPSSESQGPNNGDGAAVRC